MEICVCLCCGVCLCCSVCCVVRVVVCMVVVVCVCLRAMWRTGDGSFSLADEII